ncbi:MAG: formate dehydrogenase subunit gamma [Burkholderiaceae bacterium]|jgi:formate dehydrogenase subunit gamma|nr:formate dehydrogenase subunit gamma [Burkholderiaceae bacterium]
MKLATMSAWVRAASVGIVLALGTIGAYAAGSDAAAQVAREATQPSNNAPVWRAVNSNVEHYSAIKTPEAGVLIQAGGQRWSVFRGGVITVYGGWLISLAITGVALFFAMRGPIKLKEARTGKMVKRFTLIERYAHWAVAITFMLLAITGIIILWGRYFLLPILGGSAYGPLLWLLKSVHNLVGPLFTISLIVMFVVYVRDNMPTGDDIKWLLSGGKRPAHRFNGGEKMWFWGGVTGLGIVVSVTGWILNSTVPGIDYFTREAMQLSNIIHGIASILFIAMSIGHIYIGSIGMEGSYDGMRSGSVDESWAKEHHALWLDDVNAGADHRGRRPT